jgi:hypothetical protein
VLWSASGQELTVILLTRIPCRFPLSDTVSLGLVFRATDEKEVSDSSAQYAIKLERASKKRQRPPSEHEANVLQILADANVSPRIPRMIDYGYDKPSHSNALVLDLLGANIQSLRQKCGGRFSIKTTLTLAIRLVCVPDSCVVYL